MVSISHIPYNNIDQFHSKINKEIPKEVYLLNSRKKDPQPLIAEVNSLASLTDIEFIFNDNVDINVSKLYSLLSVHIRRVRTLPMFFIPDFQIHSPHIQVTDDGQRISDNGSSSWYTIRTNIELEWGNIYYYELLIEKCTENRFIMTGLETENHYPKQGCLGKRFYGADWTMSDVFPGAVVGCVCDLSDHEHANFFLILNNNPKGLRFSIHRPQHQKLIPVVSLACGNNTIRIRQNVNFPTCNWNIPCQHREF